MLATQGKVWLQECDKSSIFNMRNAPTAGLLGKLTKDFLDL